MRIAIFLIAIIFSNFAFAGDVVTSIKPIHSLVSKITKNTGMQPYLLLDGYASPHSFQLKPSQIKKINDADVIFYINNGFEYFLKKAVNNSMALKVELSKAENLGLIELSEHEEEAGHDHHHHANYDYHIWLSPKNAQLILQQVAKTLSLKYPEHKATYQSNLQEALVDMEVLDKKITTQIALVKGKKYILFHDSFRYFEREYGISNSGMVRVNVNSKSSAKHISALRNQITRDNIDCIFSEPQFGSDIIDTVTSDLPVKTGMLDPLGSGVKPGSDMYNGLLLLISGSIVKCLK